MSNIVVIDNTDPKAAAAALKLKRDAALVRVEAKQAAKVGSLASRKKNSRKVADGKIAAQSVRKYCPFAYADGRVNLVPMTQKTAIAIGMKITEQAFIKVAGTRILGVKSVGKMKKSAASLSNW